MTNVSSGTKMEETINEVARCARRLRSVLRMLLWAILPCAVIMISSVMVVFILVCAGQRVTTSNILIFWIGILALPGLPLIAWMVVEQWRGKRAYGKLDAIFVPGHAARQSLSASAIGSLLDVTVIGGMNGRLLQAPAALLGDLLRSVQAEDEVFLTIPQRTLLHTLVMQGYWDWVSMHDGHGLQEAERCGLRPSAISALALLGNRSSIPVLERFARKTDDPELRQSALQSIAQIHERLQYGPEQMLRASRAPECPDTLLRAAPGDKPQSYDQQQLLRADNADVELQGKSALQQTGERATPAPNVVSGSSKSQ